MKKIILSTIVAAAALVTSASADVKVGLGVDVFNTYPNPVGAIGRNSLGSTLGSTPVIRVPIVIDDSIRIEPRLAYFSSSTDQGVRGVNDNIRLVYGIGGYYTIAKVENANMYVGGQLDFITASYKNTSYTGTSTTQEMNGLALGAVIGVEYFMAPNFSLASELGFAYTSTTFVDIASTATGAATDLLGTDLSPITSVTFRYYF